MTKRLCCSKCRAANAQRVALRYVDSSSHRKVQVERQIAEGRFCCSCLICGYSWLSSAKEAAYLFEHQPRSPQTPPVGAQGAA